ncbi:unnamed protein product [Aphanomyces euteiches]|uniref:Uncharacterized protein n=1 Tax=Aphanomyces euteiches TaxID=100861 RepID=A0A6G0WFT7_9STRA|nr:hypothetical protein Ae201684_016216 [Aphanomyces euteiches]KAH9095313.1 hypothetical protein Ae201684P_013429 [Aphanomyces euteiches]KAH9136711.1 hypothetical protein AeRB84_018282 [Aphanomyces euteiches]
MKEPATHDPHDIVPESESQSALDSEDDFPNNQQGDPELYGNILNGHGFSRKRLSFGTFESYLSYHTDNETPDRSINLLHGENLPNDSEDEDETMLLESDEEDPRDTFEQSLETNIVQQVTTNEMLSQMNTEIVRAFSEVEQMQCELESALMRFNEHKLKVIHTLQSLQGIAQSLTQ